MRACVCVTEAQHGTCTHSDTRDNVHAQVFRSSVLRLPDRPPDLSVREVVGPVERQV